MRVAGWYSRAAAHDFSPGNPTRAVSFLGPSNAGLGLAATTLRVASPRTVDQLFTRKYRTNKHAACPRRPHARRRRGLPARAHRASARVRIQRASTSASDEVFLERPSRRPVSDRAAVRPHRQPLAAESANDWKGGGKTSQKQIPTAADPTRTLLNSVGGLAADWSPPKGLTPT